MMENPENEIVKVRRTPDNVRKRPNGQNRHNPFEGDS